ncbi:hypothetical protein [Candidatus Methanoliparum sp. LAM-1]|uniref:hypothetical protein n=1 Tax=Candidatus Methanoliparum sp. LAM-1 TaxID=2874846 RepID=UPI001E61B648|nr:hypothetical protein [Candidatus Methanoliparum sp. LAM-1]BDC36101.1 preprotein translocase subunit SecD [Candidatus Methanoliparum sp. LAM-1]
MNKLFKSIRFWILIILVILSIFLIHPTVSDGRFKTNLNFGLDLDGGSYLRLRADAVVISVDLDKNLVSKAFLEELIGGKVTIVSLDDNGIVFTIDKEVPQEILSSYGLTVESEDGNIRMPISYERIVAIYLSEMLNAEVIPIVEDNTLRYELRKTVDRDEIEKVIQPVGGKLTYYDDRASNSTLEQTKTMLEKKLNALGSKDIVIRTIGNKYILIDLAGVNLSDTEKIVSTPGVFEIRIMADDGQYKKILSGDDIAEVDPAPRSEDGIIWGAGFTLNEAGASKFRNACIRYNAVNDPEKHPIAMYLDGELVYSAPLSPDLASMLKDEKVYSLFARTGIGDTGKMEARNLIIHLSTGVLPVKLITETSGQVPATLGDQFKKEIVLIIILAIIAVSIITGYRYKEYKIVLPMLSISFSEVLIIVGISKLPLIGWQLDLPSIAGIIGIIGTGIDQLIIITDDMLSEEKDKEQQIKKKQTKRRIKTYEKRLTNAFKIIFISAATTSFAMLPLLVMGLGKLTGFALTIIIGVLIGVLVTRPAYGGILRDIMISNKE